MKLLPRWITLLCILTLGVVEIGARMVVTTALPAHQLRPRMDPLPVPTPRGILYEITAYSHGCTMPGSGREPVAARTASGVWPMVGRTVAADKALHPFGDRVEIDGMGTWVVHDRGSAIKGRKLDVFLNTCKEARQFGRQWRIVR